MVYQFLCVSCGQWLPCEERNRVRTCYVCTPRLGAARNAIARAWEKIHVAQQAGGTF